MRTGAGTDPAESQVSVLVGGLVTVAFGTFAVLAAIGLGWVAAAALGVVLLVVAWKVPLSAPARMLRYLLGGVGGASLLGALFELLT
ncbi:MAG TPA: hypothetical protein VFL69_15845 [Marmoricola sp.]|nr:hypothetical protein [Marmoricola sp.]